MAAINVEFKEPRNFEQTPTTSTTPNDECGGGGGGGGGLSVTELESLPLKKRLEILFIANIIPSRRQLAYKYGLDERFIHNLLSHRNFILTNWKYNADGERLLTKIELEKAMAFMELMLEWKHRVELSGLQMTHAALLRKAIALRKILKIKQIEINEDWWQLFADNWTHKQFRDSENDSLEFEDILNDLQWLFGEGAYKRLTQQLKRAREERGGVAGGQSRTNAHFEDFLDLSDEQQQHDASDISAETLYYNDDEFDFEDYEFVMDEELVLESLRRELADVETAKYLKFHGCDKQNFEAGLLVAEKIENSTPDETEFILEYENLAAADASVDDGDDNLEFHSPLEFAEDLPNEAIYFTNEETTVVVPVSIHTAWKEQEEDAVTEPLETETQYAVQLAYDGEEQLAPADPPPLQPKPFKRKPRDMKGKLTVRKDCVRLPAKTKIVGFAKNFKIPATTHETSKTKISAENLYFVENCDNNKTTSTSTISARLPPAKPVETENIKILNLINQLSSSSAANSFQDKTAIFEAIEAANEVDHADVVRVGVGIGVEEIHENETSLETSPTTTCTEIMPTTFENFVPESTVAAVDNVEIINSKLQISNIEETESFVTFLDADVVDDGDDATNNATINATTNNNNTSSKTKSSTNKRMTRKRTHHTEAARKSKRLQAAFRATAKNISPAKIDDKINLTADENDELLLGLLNEQALPAAATATAAVAAKTSATGSKRRKQNFKDKLKITSVQILNATPQQLQTTSPTSMLLLTPHTPIASPPAALPPTSSPPPIPPPLIEPTATFVYENDDDDFLAATHDDNDDVDDDDDVQLIECNLEQNAALEKSPMKSSQSPPPPPPSPSPPSPAVKTVYKRHKRRMDDSDLRLRRDKVRVSLVVVGDQAAK